MGRRFTSLVLSCAILAFVNARSLAAPSGPGTAASGNDAIAPELANADTSAANSGALHVEAGLNFTTADFFRGIRQTENSPIFQPFGSIHLDCIRNEDFSFGGFAGVSVSASEKSNNGAPFLDYENDLMAGVNGSWQNLKLAIAYHEYHSPAGAFASVNEIGARLDVDDSQWMKNLGMPISLNPHVGLYREVLDQNHGASIRSQPGKQNSYLEIGIRPEYRLDLDAMKNMPITFGLPVTAGMSWDNYYSLTPGAPSNFFGYMTAGLTASIPLPMPDNWGRWELFGSLDWMHDFAAAARAVNRGHADFYFGGAGIALRY